MYTLKNEKRLTMTLNTLQTTQDYINIEEKLGAHNYHPLDVVISKADGVWVEDVEGNRFLDCLAAYSAVNQGHCNPTIMKAFLGQVEKVTLTSRAFRNDQLPRLYQQLSEMTGYQMSLPMNSGAEAVETAVKAARKWGYTIKGVEENQAEIIVVEGNFHGRTITVVSFSTEEQYKEGYGPMTPGFKTIPYNDAAALENAITPNTVGFLVEPIQGEAGIVIPDDGYLKECADICKKHNVLFMCDEIQSGLGRSGKLFAHNYEDVRPDMVIIGKALSGGFYPVSAVLADSQVLGVFKPGDHGSTFGGNPLGAAVATAALQVIEDEGLIERSHELGKYFMERLAAIDSPYIKEVRGKGLWIGVEMDRNARPYCEELMGLGILCKETHDTVIRIAPPLVITKEEIDWAMERFEKVLVKEK
ncbi:MAG: ornithine aminotransferase [Candidatus Kapaibacteriales bacterium]